MPRTLAFALLLLLPAGLPAQGNRITFRADHTVLVDGKPFFPLGLYYCAEEFEDQSGKLLRELRGHGFNTLDYYRWGVPAWRAELDRAHRAGFKVWIRGHNGFAIENDTIAKAAAEQVRQTRDHPALLFWEFQDEPIYNKIPVEASRKGYELVKREDPNHPLLVVEWPGAADRFHLWKGIGDVFATDLYPIPRERRYGRLPNHDITQPRDYLAALRRAHGDRPLLLVLQGWAWDPLKDGERGYPTVAESRFMAYQSVVHGAKGLLYYGQVHCTKPNSAAALEGKSSDPKARAAEFAECLELNRKFWAAHKSLIQELEKAGRVFVLPDARPDARFTLAEPASTIEMLTKQSANETYLVGVNADAKPHAASFRLPGALRDLKEIHVLFEGRKLPVRGGAFRDEFRPYDVHVYRTAAEPPAEGK